MPPVAPVEVPASLEGYEWGDQQWMSSRAGKHQRTAPISAYEVHLGSWTRAPGEQENGWLTYVDLADQLAVMGGVKMIGTCAASSNVTISQAVVSATSVRSSRLLSACPDL